MGDTSWAGRLKYFVIFFIALVPLGSTADSAFSFSVNNKPVQNSKTRALDEVIDLVFTFHSYADCVRKVKSILPDAKGPPRIRHNDNELPSSFTEIDPEAWCQNSQYPFSTGLLSVEFHFLDEARCEADLGSNLEGTGAGLFSWQSPAGICRSFPFEAPALACEGDCCDCTNNAGICQPVSDLSSPFTASCFRGPFRGHWCTGQCL